MSCLQMAVPPRPSHPSHPRPTLLVLLFLASCTAEIGEPLDFHGDEEEDLSIEITNQKVSDFERSTCSTSSVAPLSTQIAEEMLCIAPGVLVKLEEGNGLSFRSSAVLPYMEAEAAQHLLEVADRSPVELSSGFRTVVQQYLLYTWRAQRRCGITAAAKPGNSNHESGRAIDVANRSSVRSLLRGKGWRDYFSNDPVHFEHRASPDMRGLDVHAFQRLWNRNNPNDRINEDGDYGPSTAARLRKAPAAGFPIGPECNGAAAANWYGDTCEDDDGCELPANNGTCMTWTDGASSDAHGMCVSECTEICPDRSGEVATFCAKTASGEGKCVPHADTMSGNCDSIAGTAPTTARRFELGGGTSSTVATVCLPADESGIECSKSGREGECINKDIMTCDGTLVTGACPGPSAIRCCLAP